MGYLDSLNITGSALTTERFHMDIIMQNLANQNITKMVDGEPYRRKQVALRENQLDFRQGLGKAIIRADNGSVFVEEAVDNESPLAPVYDPNHPDAGEDGYVMMPNINSVEEMVDLMAASRTHGANVTALNIAKSMALKTLETDK